MTVNLKLTEFNPEDFKEFTADDFDENLRGKQKTEEELVTPQRKASEPVPVPASGIMTDEGIAELGRRSDPIVKAQKTATSLSTGLKGGLGKVAYTGKGQDPFMDALGTLGDIPSDIVETGKAIGDDYKKYEEKLREIDIAQGLDVDAPTGTLLKPKKEGVEPEQGELRSIGHKLVLGGMFLSNVIGDVFTGLLKVPFSPEAEDILSKKLEEAVGSAIDTPIEGTDGQITWKDAISGMVRTHENIKKEDPARARDIEAGVGIAALALEVLTLGKAKGGADIVEKSLLKASRSLATSEAKAGIKGIVRAGEEKLASGVSGIGRKFKGTRESISGIVRGETAEKKVAGFISEKPTAAASRKALEQGRIEPGKSVISERLFGRKPGEIAPTQRIERAQDVITDAVKNKRISTSDPQSFYTGVKEEGLTRAKNLEPRLAEIGLSDVEQTEFVQYITDIKNEYVGSDFAKKVLTAKERNALEAALDDMLKAENANDIWVARKNFDNHIPDRVKQASSTSDVSVLQSQAFWKEVRNGMNDGLEEVANKFDVDVRTEFDDMASLFEARENMIAKAPDLLKAKKGALGKEDINKLLIRIGLGGLGLKLFLD